MGKSGRGKKKGGVGEDDLRGWPQASPPKCWTAWTPPSTPNPAKSAAPGLGANPTPTSTPAAADGSGVSRGSTAAHANRVTEMALGPNPMVKFSPPPGIGANPNPVCVAASAAVVGLVPPRNSGTASPLNPNFHPALVDNDTNLKSSLPRMAPPNPTIKNADFVQAPKGWNQLVAKTPPADTLLDTEWPPLAESSRRCTPKSSTQVLDGKAVLADMPPTSDSTLLNTNWPSLVESSRQCMPKGSTQVPDGMSAPADMSLPTDTTLANTDCPPLAESSRGCMPKISTQVLDGKAVPAVMAPMTDSTLLNTNQPTLSESSRGSTPKGSTQVPAGKSAPADMAPTTDADRLNTNWPTLAESSRRSTPKGSTQVPAGKSAPADMAPITDAEHLSSGGCAPDVGIQQNASTSSSKSFSAALKTGVPELEDNYQTDAELSAEFCRFLREFKNKEPEECKESDNEGKTATQEELKGFYRSSVSVMKEQRSFTFIVHFKHMIKHNREWAFTICNHQDTILPLLVQATREFLSEEGLSEREDLIFKNTKISFIGMPRRVQTLKDFLKGKGLAKYLRLFASDPEIQKFCVLIPTPMGRFIFLSLLAFILDLHDQNMTLKGAFEMDDIVVVDGVIKILKDPVMAMLDERPKDLHKLEKLLIDLYRHKDGRLPLYFGDLQNELLQADESKVSKRWFRNYLRYHVAIMPSRARKNLIDGIRHVLRKFEQLAGPAFFSLLQQAPPDCYNWTSIILIQRSHCKILKGIYSYKNPEEEEDEEEAIQVGEHQQVELDNARYNRTAHSLLNFARNFNEHGDEYVSVYDLDELELYQAEVFSFFLPWLLKNLMKECEMTKHFGSTWSDFKSSKYDDWDATVR